MTVSRSLSDWLAWQETLNPAEIDLGLDRVRKVAARLDLKPPRGRVFIVGGTNGKGTTAAAVEALLRAQGLHTGLYTSPHLIRYNERICIDAQPVDDAMLVAAFERIEAARGDTPLTFFEFGTLAALQIFGGANLDAWVLEVGLGGRLDAVNIVDADVALLTTVALDHEEWLGDNVEAIGLEKAGIMRAGRPACFGDTAMPASVGAEAARIGASLKRCGRDYFVTEEQGAWAWRGATRQIDGLRLPGAGAEEYIRNYALALAGVEAAAPELLADHDRVKTALANVSLPGRLQELQDEHHWVLDVAHNTQAALLLREHLRGLPELPTTFVLGMLGDKRATEFVACLDELADVWLVCTVEAARGRSAEQLARDLRGTAHHPVLPFDNVVTALAAARERTPVGGRIVVCGSFYVVGPALDWLGLY
jgi:dihydrofolate synthase/folylpolyglutamate synthase